MNCKNCETTLKSKDGYCSNCGARVIEERITLAFIFKELLDKVLSVDNKLLKTFWHLFTKPHQVIDGYISGIRKRYFNPFSYLLISITLAGISFYFMKDLAIQSLEAAPSTSTSTNPFQSKGMAEGLITFIFDFQALLTAISIPLYGFVSWIVFLNKKKYNFLEHLIIYIYATAQISILNFIITTPLFFIQLDLANTLTFIMSVAVPIVYNTYVLIKLFNLTVIQTVLKLLYFILIGGVLYFIVSIVSGIAMYLYLGKEYFDQFNLKIQKDSIQKTLPIDSIKVETNKDPKAISYYDAVSKLNCFS